VDTTSGATKTPAGGFDDAEEALTEALAQEAFVAPSQTRMQAFWRFILVSRSAAITVVAIILFIFFSVSTTTFIVPDNLLSMIRNVSLIGIVSVGFTYLFVAGEIDLSIGSVYGFLAMIMGLLAAQRGIDPWLAMIVVIALGAVIGLVNGLIVVRVGIPSFIVTLAMLTGYRSAALLVNGDQPLVTTGIGSFYDLTGGYLGGTVPWLIVWMLAVVAIGSVVLSQTKFGYHVYATGGNLEAARSSGINTGRVKLVCFMFTSALCGLIAALLYGYLHVAAPTTGTGFEFRVAGAVLLGGIALSGGRGTIYGSFVGAVIIGMMTNGLVLLGLSTHHADLATGLLIMVTGALDLYVRRAASRSLQYLEA
jgi:ribose transport system permease protein